MGELKAFPFWRDDNDWHTGIVVAKSLYEAASYILNKYCGEDSKYEIYEEKGAGCRVSVGWPVQMEWVLSAGEEIVEGMTIYVEDRDA